MTSIGKNGKRFIQKQRKRSIELTLSPDEQRWLTGLLEEMHADEINQLHEVSKDLIDHACLILLPQLKAGKHTCTMTIKAAMFLDTICDAGLEYAIETKEARALLTYGGFFGKLKLKLHRALHTP